MVVLTAQQGISPQISGPVSAQQVNTVKIGGKEPQSFLDFQIGYKNLFKIFLKVVQRKQARQIAG
jgi:hypothetical protein